MSLSLNLNGGAQTALPWAEYQPALALIQETPMDINPIDALSAVFGGPTQVAPGIVAFGHKHGTHTHETTGQPYEAGVGGHTTYDLETARALHEQLGGYLLHLGDRPHLYAVCTESEAVEHWGRAPEKLAALAPDFSEV